MGEILACDLKTKAETRIAAFDGQLGEVSPDTKGDWLVAAIKSGAQYGLLCGRSKWVRVAIRSV